MNKLIIKSDQTTDTQNLTKEIEIFIKLLPGGETLLNDVLKDGDFTIHLYEYAGPACNIEKRIITAPFHGDIVQFEKLLLQNRRVLNQHKFKYAFLNKAVKYIFEKSKYIRPSLLQPYIVPLRWITFELCNAANPLLNEIVRDKTIPLSFINPQEFSTFVEKMEWHSVIQFHTICKNVTFHRVPLSYEVILPSLEEHLFTMVFHEHSQYGPSKTHYGMYMQQYVDYFDRMQTKVRCSDNLIKKLDTLVQTNRLPQNVSFYDFINHYEFILKTSDKLKNYNQEVFPHQMNELEKRQHCILDALNSIKSDFDGSHEKYNPAFEKQYQFKRLEMCLLHQEYLIREMVAIQQLIENKGLINVSQTQETINEMQIKLHDSQIWFNQNRFEPIQYRQIPFSLKPPDPLTFGYHRPIHDVRTFTGSSMTVEEEQAAQEQYDKYGYTAPGI